MTPEPPSPSDGSALPPRHRPNLGTLAKDTTETDLWAFDDVDPDADDSAPPVRKAIASVIPVPRDLDKSRANTQRESPLPPVPAAEERVRVNVSKAKNRPAQASPSPSNKAGSDFDDLDHWDDPEDLVVPLAVAAEPVRVISPPEKKAEEVIPQVVAPEPVVAPKPIVNENVTPIAVTPEAQSLSALFKLNLSKFEWIGIIALVALLFIGGVVFFLNTIHRLPTASIFPEENHYPIVGKHLTVVAGENYWRAPAATDSVRRGSQLIPVVKLKFSGGPAAIRVFFRDAEGQEIGDTVTRLVTDGKEIEIPATAGFDDVGMHAAYRTGQNKPWTVDILEAPSENSAGKDFQKLFQMNISSARR